MMQHRDTSSLHRFMAAVFGLGLLWSAAERSRAAPATYGPAPLAASVYPPQQLPLRFSHAVHLQKGMQCTQCHTDVDSSRRTEDWNFPSGQVCDRCHTVQHPRPRGVAPRCELCHTGVQTAESGAKVAPRRIEAPPARLRFSHALHASKGATCETCHKGMQRTGLATTAALPREADCLVCHDGVEATARCSACHPSDASGRLETTASKPQSLAALVPTARSNWGAVHDLGFVQDHTAQAKANPQLCQSCHDESGCIECHAGLTRPLRLHPADYMTTHALDARGRVLDCDSCHRTTTFCTGCHQRLGFGDRSEGFGVGSPLRFHPDGWSGPPGLPQAHATAAQRNLAACVSCHTEDSCLACHATTGIARPGLGVSPHGPGFADSPRCVALEARNRRMCLKCHPPGAPQLNCGSSWGR